MESLGLFAVLLVIVFVGYLVFHVTFTIAEIVFEFIENNLLKAMIIALVVLALWAIQH